MHILFLNRAYLPDPEATGQCLAQLTEDLARSHRVSVLCGRPLFAELEAGLFPYRLERWGAVDVWRAWGTRMPKGVPAGRILNHASFFAAALVAARRLPRPDLVVSLTDPPFLGLLALHLKRRFRIPFVYYCQDLYPDVAQAVNMAPRPLAAAFDRVQRRILNGADRVVAVGHDIAARLLAKGVGEASVTIVENWADTTAIAPMKQSNPFRESLGLDDRFVVMYSGNFGHVWDLDVVLDVAAMLRRERRIVFVLIGDGSTRERIVRQTLARELENVRLLPYQPKEKLGESLSAADLHIIPMRAGVYGTMVPSKIYGVLASGTAMAVLAEDESEAAWVVRTHDCGWVAEPGDTEALAKIVREAAADSSRLAAMGERARTAAENHYSRAGQTAKFAAVLESVLEHFKARSV